MCGGSQRRGFLFILNGAVTLTAERGKENDLLHCGFALGHHSPIVLGSRPFDTVEEEAKVLISNINDMLTFHDDLYILGDFSYRITREEAQEYLKQIHTKIHMVWGIMTGIDMIRIPDCL